MNKKSNKESLNIKEEVKKILYTYNLNKVIRYNQKRKEKYQTQSVAEHVLNMIFLAYYFRDLEDPQHKMDFNKVLKIIMMHDMGEIETGDIITTNKTPNDFKNELKAIKMVAKKSPKFVADEILSNFMNFEEKKTREGQFAKAIDRIEGELFWYNENGEKLIKSIHGKNTMKNELWVYKKDIDLFDKYNFPIIKSFLEFIHKDRLKRKVFED